MPALPTPAISPAWLDHLHHRLSPGLGPPRNTPNRLRLRLGSSAPIPLRQRASSFCMSSKRDSRRQMTSSAAKCLSGTSRIPCHSPLPRTETYPPLRPERFALKRQRRTRAYRLSPVTRPRPQRMKSRRFSVRTDGSWSMTSTRRLHRFCGTTTMTPVHRSIQCMYATRRRRPRHHKPAKSRPLVACPPDRASLLLSPRRPQAVSIRSANPPRDCLNAHPVGPVHLPYRNRSAHNRVLPWTAIAIDQSRHP